MAANSFPLLRITILGSEGCGKTSIADVFVNNVMARSNPPQPTTLPRLMYRVFSLPSEDGDQQPMISPVIFLVANKTDVDPQGDVPTRLLGRAELFAQQVFCRLWHVSAFTGKNIKKMFVDMAQLILSNGMLWELDYHEESGSEESEEERCVLM
ncbi:Ras family domain containing protein, putative [Eimeria brunetti]|uniref:Ras family domain containing protein, putative n=1 Tax=Eimeria brunetti TaxID=51314 RepID=U6LID8_9EIME|nr:Ras family domain containing protein, putative [Eimeria brunetti]